MNYLLRCTLPPHLLHFGSRCRGIARRFPGPRRSRSQRAGSPSSCSRFLWACPSWFVGPPESWSLPEARRTQCHLQAQRPYPQSKQQFLVHPWGSVGWKWWSHWTPVDQSWGSDPWVLVLPDHQPASVYHFLAVSPPLLPSPPHSFCPSLPRFPLCPLSTCSSSSYLLSPLGWVDVVVGEVVRGGARFSVMMKGILHCCLIWCPLGEKKGKESKGR